MHQAQIIRAIVKPSYLIFDHAIAIADSKENRLQYSLQLQQPLTLLRQSVTDHEYALIVDSLTQLSYQLMSTVIAFHSDNDDFDFEIIDTISTAMALNRIRNRPIDDLQAIHNDCNDLMALLNSDHDVTYIIDTCLVSSINTTALSDIFDIKITETLKEHVRSTMSILWPDDIDTRQQYLNNLPMPTQDVAFKLRADGGDGLLGYHANNGEIIYPPTYSKANYSTFVTDKMCDYIINN